MRTLKRDFISGSIQWKKSAGISADCIDRNFENAVADIGENAECLFGTLPEQDHATLRRLDFCSTSITEAGNSDDFVFLFENGIAVYVCTILCEEDKHTA